MKFKLKVAKLEDVAEAHRGLYQEAADKSGFVLKDEFEIADPPDVIGLTKNRDTILAEKTTLETRFKDIDPDKARAALAKVAELEAKGVTEADRIKKIEESLAEEKTAREAADRRADEQLIRAEGAKVLAAAGANETGLALLPQIFEKRVKVVSGVLTVVGDDGKTPMLDAKGAPMTTAGLVDSVKAQPVYAAAFAATGAGGSGAPAGATAGKIAPGGKVSSADQSAFDVNLEAIAKGEVVVTD